MAAQKCKKNLLTEMFGIFECLVAQNPTNQDSQLFGVFRTTWKAVRKLKNMGFQGIFLPENDFKTCSTVNSREWLKNKMLWFLELNFI